MDEPFEDMQVEIPEQLIKYKTDKIHRQAKQQVEVEYVAPKSMKSPAKAQVIIEEPYLPIKTVERLYAY